MIEQPDRGVLPDGELGDLVEELLLEDVRTDRLGARAHHLLIGTGRVSPEERADFSAVGGPRRSGRERLYRLDQ